MSTVRRAAGRLLLAAVLAGAVAVALSATQAGYIPLRVFDAGKQGFTDLEAMLADVVRADLVFVGEQHGHAETHRIELAVLEGLARRKRDVILAMEMFDRDAQDPLDHFLMGHLTEADFLAAARPWPRYATDYKPLVDLAMRRGWPVIAANAPQPVSAEVVQGGLDVLKTKSEADRARVAKELRCPTDDAYFKRFRAALDSDHLVSGVAAEGGRSAVDRAYLAQCLRDETMAESMAQVLIAGASGGKRPLVVMINGAFHSDFGGGVVERTRRRLPDKRALIVSVVPVENLDALVPEIGLPHRADYVVYVLGSSAVR